MMSSIKFSS